MSNGTAVAVMEKEEVGVTTAAVRSVGLLRPLAPPKDVLLAQNETRAMVAEALENGRDYGKIPGTKKPTLYKPGAERLVLAFGLAPRFRLVASEVDHDRAVHWTKIKKGYNGAPDTIVEGDSIGLYRFVVECEMAHRETGVAIASCIASCSSMESKYVDRPRDIENTIIKMAEKRAFVGATLLALGLSDEFTQDVEDLAANGALDTDNGEAASDEPEAHCPKCNGRMWDNRASKTNPKAPDFRCRDRKCDGAFWPGEWPPKTETAADATTTVGAITRDTEWNLGQYAGTKVRDLPLDFLKWAVEEGRKLGDRTTDWQDAFNMELDERAAASAPHADSEPTYMDAADVPKQQRSTRRKPPLSLTDEIPF